MKNLTGGFEVKNFRYIYSLFTGKHFMESEAIEYGYVDSWFSNSYFIT